MADIKITHSFDYNQMNDRNEIDDLAVSFLEKYANKEDLAIDLESLLSKESDKKTIDLDRFLGFLQTILDPDLIKAVIGGGDSSNQMLKIANLLSSSLLLKEAKEGENNTKKAPLANVTLLNDLSVDKDKTDPSQIKDGSLKDGSLKDGAIKDLPLKDSSLKESILNNKDINIFSNQEKSINTDKNQLVSDRSTLKNQVESMLKSDSIATNKIVIKDGLVVLHSVNGSLSMDNLNTVGARGDISFLDNSREFANQSGYKENSQSGHKENGDEDENENDNDRIYFSGD